MTDKISQITSSSAPIPPPFIPDSTTNCVICLDTLNEEDDILVIPECGHPTHNKCDDMWRRMPKTNHASLGPEQQEKTCATCRHSIKNAKIYKRLGNRNTFLFVKYETRSTTPTTTPAPITPSITAPIPQTHPQPISAISLVLARAYGEPLAQAYGVYRDPSIYVDVRPLRRGIRERIERETRPEPAETDTTSSTIGIGIITSLALIAFAGFRYAFRGTNS